MSTPSKAKPLIVVIDDDAGIRELIELALSSREVRCFPDGISALKWFENSPEHPIELVLSDYEMPGMTGVDTIKTIRGLKPALKCILMSGSSIDDLEKNAMDAGCVTSLRKPFRLTELMKVIELHAGSDELQVQ